MRTNHRVSIAGVMIAAIAMLGLAGCNSGGPSNETSRAGMAVGSAPLETTAGADWIPSLADLRAHVQMTDDQATSIDAALTEWRTAASSWRDKMHAGGPRFDRADGLKFPPIAQFLSECGQTLQTDQFVTLTNYLHAIQTTHKSQIADVRKHFGDMMEDRIIRRLVDQLALRPDQEKQVRQIVQDFREARMQAFAQGKGSAPDTAGFRRMNQDLLSRLAGVLTPDQLAQFKKLQEKRFQRWDTSKDGWKSARIANAVGNLQGVLQLSDGQVMQIKTMLANLPAPQPPNGEAGRPGWGLGWPKLERGGQLLKAESQIRSVLSPDQIRRLDAVLQLLPGQQDRP